MFVELSTGKSETSNCIEMVIFGDLLSRKKQESQSSLTRMFNVIEKIMWSCSGQLTKITNLEESN
jgi:hypothetical protein